MNKPCIRPITGEEVKKRVTFYDYKLGKICNRTFANELEAMPFYQEQMAIYEKRRQQMDAQCPLVRDGWEEYQENKRTDVKLSSYEVTTANLYRNFVRHYENAPLDRMVTNERLNEIKNRLIKKGLTDGVINSIYGSITEFFEICLDKGWITDKDFNLVKRRLKKKKKIPKSDRGQKYKWTKEQSLYFLKCLEEEHSIWYIFFLLEIYGGYRVNEIKSLRLKNYHRKEGYIEVESQFVNSSTYHKCIETTLKTNASKRKVRYERWIFDKLDEWIKIMRIKNPNDFLFFGGSKPIGNTTINSHLAKFRKKYKMPYASIHTLRHNAITYCLDNPNMTVQEIGQVSRRFGTSVEMCLEIYQTINEKESERVIKVI